MQFDRLKRRELLTSKKVPWNRHFLHQKCLGSSFPDTFDSSFVRASLDDRVGGGEQGRRDFEAERLSRLEIEAQFKFGWLLHGKIGRLGTLEDSIDEDGGPTE